MLPSSEDKAALRREQVRLNVKAFRERQKQKQSQASARGPASTMMPTIRWVAQTKWKVPVTSHTKNPPAAVKRDEEEKRQTEQKSLKRSSATLQLRHEPTAEKQYTLAVLDKFRATFLPGHVNTAYADSLLASLTPPCASLMIKAFDAATDDEAQALRNMLQSISLATVAQELQMEDMRIKSIDRYQASLTQMRRGILRVGKNISSDEEFLPLLYACHVAAMFELTIRLSLWDSLRHVQGLGAMISFRLSKDPYISEACSDLIEEYRMLETPFCLGRRQPSSLVGYRNRVTVVKDVGLSDTRPWERTNPACGPLTDISDRICEGLVTLDALQELDVSERPLWQLTGLIRSCCEILDSLDIWTDDFLHRFGSQIHNRDSTSSLSVCLQFETLVAASSHAASLSYRLYTLDIFVSACRMLAEHQASNKELDHALQSLNSSIYGDVFNTQVLTQAQEDILETARLQLRSLPYFYQDKVGVTGRMLSCFPLQSINHALSNKIWTDPAPQWSQGVGSTQGVATAKRIEQTSYSFDDMRTRYRELAASARSFGLLVVSNDGDWASVMSHS